MSLFAFELSEPAKVSEPNEWSRGRYDPATQSWVTADGIRCADDGGGGGGGGTTYECGWQPTGQWKILCDPAAPNCTTWPDKDPHYCAD